MIGLITATAVSVALTISSGLTNATPITTYRTLSADDAGFYGLTIYCEDFNLPEHVNNEINVAVSNDFADIDFSCVSDYGKQATLVAPDIAIGCRHYHNNVGDVVSFGGETAIVTRVELAVDGPTSIPDTSVLYLDRELSAKPALLASLNIEDYVAKYSTYCVNVNQFGGIGIQRLDSIGKYGTNAQGMAFFFPDYTRKLIDKDSGSPCFLIVEGNLVLIGTYRTETTICFIGTGIEVPVARNFLGE